MTDFETFEAGVECEVLGEVIEEVEADGLPGHSDGENVALREKQRLCWTEDLGSNIVNLDGYLQESWNEGSRREIELDGGKTFIPDTDTYKLDFIIPREELILAAKQRAGEDSTHFAYVLGNWAYLATENSHVSEVSARLLRAVFNDVVNDEDTETPDDATYEEYRGGAV